MKSSCGFGTKSFLNLYTAQTSLTFIKWGETVVQITEHNYVSLLSNSWSHGSAVGIANGYGLDNQGEKLQ
jgi:hypothetical protein